MWKKTDPRSTKKEVQLFIDISSPSFKNIGGLKPLAYDCWWFHISFLEMSDLISCFLELLKHLDVKYNREKSASAAIIQSKNPIRKAYKQEGVGVFLNIHSTWTSSTKQKNGQELHLEQCRMMEIFYHHYNIIIIQFVVTKARQCVPFPIFGKWCSPLCFKCKQDVEVDSFSFGWVFLTIMAWNVISWRTPKLCIFYF